MNIYSIQNKTPGSCTPYSVFPTSYILPHLGRESPCNILIRGPSCFVGILTYICSTQKADGIVKRVKQIMPQNSMRGCHLSKALRSPTCLLLVTKKKKSEWGKTGLSLRNVTVGKKYNFVFEVHGMEKRREKDQPSDHVPLCSCSWASTPKAPCFWKHWLRRLLLLCLLRDGMNF